MYMNWRFVNIFNICCCEELDRSIVFYDKNNIVIDNKELQRFVENRMQCLDPCHIQISYISKIGFNFTLFSTELNDIKKKILKDYFAKNYNAFAITFSQEINDFCKLTIKLSEAVKTTTQDINAQEIKGIIIYANFEQVIDEENTIWKAFNTNYNQLLEDYINEIF